MKPKSSKNVGALAISQYDNSKKLVQQTPLSEKDVARVNWSYDLEVGYTMMSY